MDRLAQYKIPFAGLSLGDHKFEYNIDNQFFANFENAILHNGNLQIELILRKQETMLLLDFSIHGKIAVICDRCAGEFDLPVDGNANLIIKLGDEKKEMSDNMIMINRHEYEINVAQYIYEYVSLLLPQRIIHADDVHGKSTCDKKTLHAIKQLNIKPQETDPRWNILRKLKL